MRSGKPVATDSSASDGVILVHVRVKMMWTGHTISFSEATFIMSVCVVLPVSCVCVQKLWFPMETCLRTRMTPPRLLLKRQEPMR